MHQKQTITDMTPLELIKKDLQRRTDYGRPMIDSYVILKKDDKGYYIEYAFKDGAPHDNRCLSWYDSYQEEAYRRNGWFKTSDGKDIPEEETRKRLDQIRRNRESNVGKMFRLSSFTCGYEEDEKGCLEEAEKSWIEHKEYHSDENGVMEPFVPEDHICKVGCPAKGCDWLKNKKHPWTYEEPVKCACWYLKDGTTMEEFINNYTISMKATELAKLL